MYEEETAIDFSPYVVEPGPGAPLELYNDELLADLFSGSGKADKSQQPDYGFLQPGAGHLLGSAGGGGSGGHQHRAAFPPQPPPPPHGGYDQRLDLSKVVVKRERDEAGPPRTSLHSQVAACAQTAVHLPTGQPTPPTSPEPSPAHQQHQQQHQQQQRALQALDGCQRELESLNERASEEILQVERKYSQLRKPHFERRSCLIHSLPGFWVTAFLNHPQLSALIDENDEETFNYMTRLEVEEFEDIKSGYRIKFHFGDNPYFENSLLIKEFHLGTGGKPVSQSTPIKWRKGMDLTALNKGVDEKGRKRGHRSFFSWFTEHRNPTTDEVAEVLKDDMWPNPLQYYLIAESDSGENGLDDSDEENGDDSVVIVDEEDDEDEEDDDDVQEIMDNDDEDEDEDGTDEDDDVEEIDDEEEVEEEGVEVEGEDVGAKEGGNG
uniref:Protein SET-like protein n=1 Tax=Callorhinchus milii TaxID=7868 RepID=V9KK48_CALMI